MGCLYVDHVFLKSKVDTEWELSCCEHTITMFELMEFMLQFSLIEVSCNNIVYVMSRCFG